jgi:putative ATP-dependent endonuclease of OLD family
LEPTNFSSLDALGIAIFDAEAEGNIAIFGEYFQSLGKVVFAVFDKQQADALVKIEANVAYPFESSYDGFEFLVLSETPDDVLQRFALEQVAQGRWPTHLADCKPTDVSEIKDIKKGLLKYFLWSKGAATCASLLASCSVEQTPATIKKILSDIDFICDIL